MSFDLDQRPIHSTRPRPRTRLCSDYPTLHSNNIIAILPSVVVGVYIQLKTLYTRTHSTQRLVYISSVASKCTARRWCPMAAEDLVWFILHPCQQDNGYWDGRSRIKVQNDVRTRVHSAQSSLVVTHPSTNRGRRALTSVNVPPS